MTNQVPLDRRKTFSQYAKVRASDLYQQFIPIMKDLYDKSIRVHHDSYPIYDLQAELLGYLLATDQIRKKCILKKELCGAAINKILLNDVPLEKIRFAQSFLEKHDKNEMISNWIIRQLRSIGDAIAWRFFKYDRMVLETLAEHDYVSVPQLDKGFVTEVNSIQLLIDQGIPFIHNSITNFLRIGDITSYDISKNTFNILEVKSSGNRSDRIYRQTIQRESVESSIKRRWVKIKGVQIVERTASTPLKTYITSINNAMTEAGSKGASSRFFGDYLSIAVLSMEKILDMSEIGRERLIQDINSRVCSIFKERDIMLPILSSIMPSAYFMRMIAPYSIFPLSYEHRFDIITGNYLVESYLNISGLARWLIKRGWMVKVSNNSRRQVISNEFEFIPALSVANIWEGQIRGVDLPAIVLAQAAMEFWMPESIEECVKTIIRQDENKVIGFHAINFPNTGKYAFD